MKIIGYAIMIALLLTACGEKEKTAPPHEDTQRSLFEEVKEQTVKNPNDVEAWYHLAEIYEQNGMYREEADALTKVVALKPDAGYAYLKLGNTYSALNRHQEAIKSYKTAIKYLPQNPVIYNNLGVAYGKVGKRDEEIAALNKAISLRPRYATARYNLGVTLLKQGNREGAMKQYQEIKKFDEGAAASLKKELDAKGK